MTDYLPDQKESANLSTQYFQKRRLLNTFAARKYPVKIWRDGKRIAHIKYLLVSALTLDTNPGACSALRDNRCGIYERRPLSCRTVPFHYSHAESLAESGLEALSMRAAWKIAAEIGVIDAGQCRRLLGTQLKLIEQELAHRRCIEDSEQTLREMRWEYRSCLTTGPASSISG